MRAFDEPEAARVGLIGRDVSDRRGMALLSVQQSGPQDYRNLFAYQEHNVFISYLRRDRLRASRT